MLPTRREAEGVLDIEERTADVRRRYGSYPQEKRERNLALKRYFEDKMGKEIYTVVDKEHFRSCAELAVVN